MRRCATTITGLLVALVACPAGAVSIVLDYSIDQHNENWFDPGTPDGLARRRAVNAAADLLSVLLTNDDWSSLSSLNESIGFTDIAAATISGPTGELIAGSPESDGQGYSYSVPTNRTTVDANEYVVYVGAFAFDSASSSTNAKAGWDSNDRRNSAGLAGSEFNTWGGRVYFNTSKFWYGGQNPDADPTDKFGVQDSDKTPASDVSWDNWEWSTSDSAWKGYDLASTDPFASSARDLYATALHEMLHALGATTSVIEDYVGVSGSGDFIGPALVAEYGGPVPGDGGHFAEDTQSIVWGSSGIVSETVLDPNSRLGVRKYLTRLDAALLADLGYQVAEDFPDSFLQGDYNGDGNVDAADYTVWRNALGGSTALANDPSFTEVNLDDHLAWASAYGRGVTARAVPEPSGLVAVATFALIAGARRRGRRVG